MGIAGTVPLRSGLLDGTVFTLWLTTNEGQYGPYHIWLRATRDIATEGDLRAFFAGTASPRARINEFSLGYPNGHYRYFPNDLPNTPKW